MLGGALPMLPTASLDENRNLISIFPLTRGGKFVYVFALLIILIYTNSIMTRFEPSLLRLSAVLIMRRYPPSLPLYLGPIS